MNGSHKVKSIRNIEQGINAIRKSAHAGKGFRKFSDALCQCTDALCAFTCIDLADAINEPSNAFKTAKISLRGL